MGNMASTRPITAAITLTRKATTSIRTNNAIQGDVRKAGIGN